MPRYREQLADLLETDLGLAARDHLTDRIAGRRDPALGFDRIGNSEALEHSLEIDAARAGRICDRFGRQQRMLECVGRADVGLRRARAHGDADAGAHEIDTAAGDELALLDEVVDAGARHDHQVGDLAALHPAHDAGGAGPGRRHLVLGCALELRDQLEIGLLDGIRAQDLEFSCVRHACNHQEAGGAERRGAERFCFHGRRPFIVLSCMTVHLIGVSSTATIGCYLTR